MLLFQACFLCSPPTNPTFNPTDVFSYCQCVLRLFLLLSSVSCQISRQLKLMLIKCTNIIRSQSTAASSPPSKRSCDFSNKHKRFPINSPRRTGIKKKSPDYMNTSLYSKATAKVYRKATYIYIIYFQRPIFPFTGIYNMATYNKHSHMSGNPCLWLTVFPSLYKEVYSKTEGLSITSAGKRRLVVNFSQAASGLSTHMHANIQLCL